MLISQPAAGSLEVQVQMAHHQVNRPTACPTDKAAEGVLADLERKAWVAIVVERTKAFVHADTESKSLCDPLDGEVAELLKFILFHCLSDKFQS